jgi:hypothetical protein
LSSKEGISIYFVSPHAGRGGHAVHLIRVFLAGLHRVELFRAGDQRIFAQQPHFANDIPVAPAILGIVLGRLLEDSFMVSIIKSDWDLSVFFHRPVSAVLGVITVILLSGPFIAAFCKWRQDVKDSNAKNKT